MKGCLSCTEKATCDECDERDIVGARYRAENNICVCGTFNNIAYYLNPVTFECAFECPPGTY